MDGRIAGAGRGVGVSRLVVGGAGRGAGGCGAVGCGLCGAGG
jgi:hypothetical protein